MKTTTDLVIDTKKIDDIIFYEKINISKLDFIINNPLKYDKIIKEQEKDMRRNDKNYNAYAVFQKIKENIFIPEDFKNTEYGLLKITYKKGKNSNGIGRYYANNGIGIQPLCCSVRHTICSNIWVDIDQVNSHPKIFKHLMNKHEFNSILLDECLTNREDFLKKVMKEEKCTRDTAKTLVISVINGASYQSHTLNELTNQLKPIINYIINLDEYKNILNYVKSNYNNNIEGKTISRILQVIENDLLMVYLQFFYNKNLIKKYNDGYICSLIFDGFQVLINNEINDELLNECRLYALDKTDYDIELKIKPFDNQLELPEDYEICDNDDIKTIINKYDFGINNYYDTFKKLIEDCLNDDGSHASISILSKAIFKDTIIYDENSLLWFQCNINNVWKKYKTAISYKSLLKSVIVKIFLIVINFYNKLKNSSEDEEEKKLYENKAKIAFKITNKLKNASFISSVIKLAECDFNNSLFFEKKIDSQGFLFAFNNKVLDCNKKEIRNISPNDYIMTTTGYNYPEYIDNNIKEIIENYYNTIYPDKDVCEYMWNNDALTLYGERKTQTFNIHTGSGSNSKSTKIIMIKGILGDYFEEMNAETFTRPPKSANATSELYKAKGKRLLFFNEPENDADNKLQVSLIKKMADGYKGIIKARGLYSENIEFPIFFRVEGACNNKPTLSSVDGGIGRRIRIIEYPVKFISNPDINNKNQALLNPNMVGILSSVNVRNTYIRMLIDRFINIASKLSDEIVPQQILNNSNEYIQDCNIVLGFIMDKYIITNNEKDRISSSEIYNKFKQSTSSKMTTSKFKDDLTNINGIIWKKMKNGQFYCGFKERDNDLIINE